jgi:hypothetical protein
MNACEMYLKDFWNKCFPLYVFSGYFKLLISYSEFNYSAITIGNIYGGPAFRSLHVQSVIFSFITLILSAFLQKYKLEFRKQKSHAGLEDVGEYGTCHLVCDQKNQGDTGSYAMANKSILEYVGRRFPTDATA